MKSLYQTFAFALVMALAAATSCVIVPLESAEELASPAHDGIKPASALTTSLPVINSFQARPELVSEGIPMTLSWNVSGATSVTIQPNIGEVPSIGSKQLSPDNTTTYILIATNSTDSKTAMVTATVIPDENKNLVNIDPVTGRNDKFDLRWEQLCLASEYQVQIAKDPNFALIVVDTGPFAPADVTSPAAYYPAGGQTAGASATPSLLDPGTSAIGSPSTLEAGHTYYARIRVRQTATGLHMLSPWSEVYKFTVKSGLPITNPNYGPQPLSPNNGCLGCPVSSVSFSWTPFQDTAKYKFVLSEDAAMTSVLVEIFTPTSAYEYEGTLQYSTNYFWQVMAIEPVPSDPSSTFTFQTEVTPAPTPAPATQAPAIPTWAWVLISTGAILVIAVLVMIILIRRGK